MQYLKNLFVHWVLPVLAALLVYGAIQEFRAPAVQLDENGAARDFALPDIDGGTWTLSEHRGRTVLVNFWAEWCGPCKAEIPALNRFAAKHPDVAVIGIAVDSGDLDSVRDHADRLGIKYPVVRGTSRVKREYGVTVLPTSFLIAEDGTIDKTHVGLITRPQLAAWAP